MSFEERSKQSMSAAQMLCKNNLYPSTINRAYYSCAQFMFHALFNILKINREDFDKEAEKNNNGTHTWAANRIAIEMAKIHRQDFIWFQRSIKELRKGREIADYQEIEIKQEEAFGLLGKATSINDIIYKRIIKKDASR